LITNHTSTTLDHKPPEQLANCAILSSFTLSIFYEMIHRGCSQSNYIAICSSRQEHLLHCFGKPVDSMPGEYVVFYVNAGNIFALSIILAAVPVMCANINHYFSWIMSYNSLHHYLTPLVVSRKFPLKIYYIIQ
jgi:hypothetical protein